jgi:hypothetical protein
VSELVLPEAEHFDEFKITLPRRKPGRQNAVAIIQYDSDLRAFCRAILQFRSRSDLEKPPSARGWGYLLEGARAIDKGDIDLVENLINDCRKSGKLPIAICVTDVSRAFSNVERLDDTTPEEEAQWAIDYIRRAPGNYNPVSFWECQKYYVQMLVEKIDLRNLFDPICKKLYVPLAPTKGWSDLNTLAELMGRFKYWEARSKICVLLVCYDLDPGGLLISDTLRSNMKEFKSVGWSPDNLIIDRFGLNERYVERYGLVWIDNLITASKADLADPDHKDHLKRYVQDYIERYGARKVEANAMLRNVPAARQLCRDAIRKYVEPKGIRKFNAVTRAEREKVADAISRLMSEGAS